MRFSIVSFLLFPFLISCSTLHPSDYGYRESYCDRLLIKYSTIKYDEIVGRTITQNPDSSGNIKSATEVRNETIEDLMYLIDSGFEEFVSHFYGTRAGLNVFSDWTTLGMATAGVLVNSAAAKTTYSTLNALFTGAKLSIEENVFQNQGPLAIVRKMEAERKKIETEISINKKRPINEYTMGEAMLQLRDYFQAGTLVHTLEILVEESGEIISSEERYQQIIQRFDNANDALSTIFEIKKSEIEAQQNVNQKMITTVRDKSYVRNADIIETVLYPAIDQLKEEKSLKLVKNPPIDVTNDTVFQNLVPDYPEIKNGGKQVTLEELKRILKKMFIAPENRKKENIEKWKQVLNSNEE